MKKTNIDFMKNFAKKNFIKLFSSIVLLLIVVFALSCDIGLGAAIDTEAPTATITYPPEGAVIRDWFVLAGTCEDDDAVEKVEVSISSSYYSTTRNAVIENKTSWRLKLNDGTNGAYNGWEFPDGDYTANVTVYDASGRSTGPYSRSFKIDNTAPIFIISSPGSTDVSSQNTFGTTINVSGTVAESNGVSKVAIAVLGDGLSEPKVLEQYNIDTSDGASIDFARFNKAEPESLESVNYKAIYGEVTVTNGVITDSNSTKNFKTTVTVSDKAYKYQSPSSGTATEKNGNTTSNVYLYDDVYQAILGESGLGLTPGELIRSVNGVLKTDSALNAKEILNNNKKDSVETSLCFALDPKARPTYSVTSLETLDKTKLSAVNAVKDDSEQLKEKAKEAISSRTISGSVITANVNVFAGSSALIETNSLKMWIHQLTKDEYVEDTLTALISNLENSVYGSSSSSGNNDSPTGWTQIAQGSGENSASVVLNSDPLANILSNEFYLVAVTGKDSSGTYLDQGTVFYALMGQPSSAMPVISLTSPEDGKYYTQSAESNLTISGSASSEENKIKSVSVSVKYTEDTEGENKQSNTQPFSGENLANSKDFTFNLSNFTNLGSVADSNNYGYTIEVEVVDTDNNKSNETRKIYIDKKAPEISLPVAEPIVASYTPENSCSQEGSYINGIFTLEVNVKESRLKELKYQIVNSENSEVLSLYDESGTKLDLTDNWYVLGTSSAYTLKTDTTKYDNDKKIKFNFKATDEAGNETQLSSDAYTIQQETDRPIITVTNADASKTSASHDLSSVSAENGQNNLFDLNTKKEIQFMVEDDDYLHNVSVTVKNINTNKSYTLTPTAALPADKTTSYSAKYSLDSALKDSSGKPVEGVYLVIITAEDATYSLASSDEVKKNRKSEAKFYIAVDTANPLLTESGIGNNVKSTNLASPISLSGSASDTNALYASDETTSGKGAISISVCKSGEENPVKVYTTDVSCSTNANSGTWSQKITKEDLTQSGSYDGSYEITITLKDAAGKTKSLVRNLLVDSVAPVFSSGPEITSSKNGSWYNTDSLAISAIVTDNKSVNSVQYAKYTGDWSSENIASGTPPASLDSEGWKNLVLTSSNIYTGTVS